MGKKSVTFASASGNSRSGYKLVKNSAFINVDLPSPDSPKIKIDYSLIYKSAKNFGPKFPKNLS